MSIGREYAKRLARLASIIDLEEQHIREVVELQERLAELEAAETEAIRLLQRFITVGRKASWEDGETVEQVSEDAEWLLKQRAGSSPVLGTEEEK